MSDRTRKPILPDLPQDDLVDDDEFHTMLREMEETFRLDQDGPDEDTEDLEQTGEISRGGEPGEPEADREQERPSLGFHMESGIVERFDDVDLDFSFGPATSADRVEVEAEKPGGRRERHKPPPPPRAPPPPPRARAREPLPEAPVRPAPVLLPEGTTLSVRFSVHAAIGEGRFRDTVARGVLGGQRSYPIVLLDDFAFGFDDRRNEWEIILEPSAAETALVELAPVGSLAVMCDDWGEMWVLKPPGVRVDAYRIERTLAGDRQMSQVRSSEQQSADPIWLPTDPAVRFDRYTEFMLGIGLTGEERLCYAFSVYIAVGLARPASDPS